MDGLLGKIEKWPKFCYPYIKYVSIIIITRFCNLVFSVDAYLFSINSLLRKLQKDVPNLFYHTFNELIQIFFTLAESRGLMVDLKLNRKRRPIYAGDKNVIDDEVLEPSPKFYCMLHATEKELLRPTLTPASPSALEEGEHIDDGMDDIKIVKS